MDILILIGTVISTRRSTSGTFIQHRPYILLLINGDISRTLSDSNAEELLSHPHIFDPILHMKRHLYMRCHSVASRGYQNIINKRCKLHYSRVEISCVQNDIINQ